MLTSRDLTKAGFYWYLDAIGSQPQVVEVVGEDVFRVRFAGRKDEDALADLSGSFVGPLRPPGAQQALSDAEAKAVRVAVSRTAGRPPLPSEETGEGHPS